MTVDLSSYQVLNGETSSASKFNNLVTAVQASLNAIGDVTKMGWLAGKIFDPNQIKQDAAVTGAHLEWDGTDWRAKGAKYRKTTEKDVVNTTTETDLLNGEITIGAGVMGTDRMARLTILGDYLNNSGGTKTLTIKLKLGSTLLFDSGASPAISATANRMPLRIVVEIPNLGAANAQWGSIIANLSYTSVTTGIGQGFTLPDAAGNVFVLHGALSAPAALDTATSKLVEVTATHSAAHASLSCRLKHALLEII